MRYVLLSVGVNTAPGATPLHFAEKDAADVYRLFTSPDGPVERDFGVPLLGAAATRGQVIRVLDQIRRIEPDIFVLFFSGHGNESEIALADETLHYSILADKIARIAAPHTLVIMDSCRSASLIPFWKMGDFLGGTLDTDWLSVLASATETSRLMFACSPTENARETWLRQNGAFTASLLRALRIAPGTLAGQGGRWFVSDCEVFDLALRLLAADGFEQTPTAIRLLGDFPLFPGRCGHARVDQINQIDAVTAQAEISTACRAGLPTVVRARFVDPLGKVVGSPSSIVTPYAHTSRHVWNVPVPVGRHPMRVVVEVHDTNGRPLGAAGSAFVRPASHLFQYFLAD
jgi:hypothetical protein